MPSISLAQCTPTDLVATSFAELEVDVFVVTAGSAPNGGLRPGDDLLALDPSGEMVAQLTHTGFTGAWGAQRWINRSAPGTILVVGTGPERAASAHVTLRERQHALAAGVAAVSQSSVGVSALGTWDPALVETVILASYRFDRYVDKARATRLVVADLGPIDEDEVAEVASGLEAVCFARDWVNAGPGDKRPAVSAALIVAEAERAGVEVRVWTTEELVAAGCGGIVGVGQGSEEPARIVQLTARGTTDAAPLVLVGKGLTYDAGGQNLKTVWLEHMKLDMGGAAAVVGAVLHAARRPRARTVEGWVALAENIISATAYLAGDVLRMHNGLSVEVVNTDAEGRLALADAMSLANASEAAAVVTVATLTGAAIRALGPRTAALMSADEDLAASLLSAAGAAGESLWRMPALPYLGDSLRSHIADTTNLGTMDGQTMVASLFLRRFAPDGVPYAHFDLAGPAFNMGEPYDGIPAGGTGYGIRTLVELLDRL